MLHAKNLSIIFGLKPWTLHVIYTTELLWEKVHPLLYMNYGKIENLRSNTFTFLGVNATF
jgi:hypothetical protein